ncbi:MAG: response regulator [candidate division Zixibacteria bacterium]|nr:response regulator [candidate division Zixibacteria bacterium]MBU1470040.1 response regulator [candidate division Zixibacteria bacterium]MBU2625533.1 response regulator [candidate division Zixibacteria bacterium]
MSLKTKIDKVLIVDSNQDMANCLADMVDEFSVRCEIVTDGEEAIKRLAREKYILVIADTHLPKMSGFSLFKHIKAHHPEVPVALISSRNSELTHGIIVKHKPDFFLPKPCTTSDIGELLAQVR